jgi:4-amino-4-deoxy-L-arabinose transferase-like glycosyltransferase
LYLHWGSLSAAQRAPLNTNGEHPPLAKLLFGVAEVMVGHPSITAARAVSAACTVSTALVLGLWLARTVGKWTGLLAGSALALIPESVLPETTRFGRSAMLDTVAGLFMVLSLVAGWIWFRSSGWRGWAWAGVAGVAVGLATSSKENGFLGLVVPAAVAVFWCLPRWRDVATREVQTVYAGAIAFGAFALTYLPLGDLHSRLSYLVRFQLDHRHDGHLVGLAGEVTMHPPWWANLWFAGQGLGAALGWLILLTALAGIVLSRTRLVWWCLGALAGPFVFHSFIAGVTLPFYWVMWLPALLALSAIGVRELVTLAIRLPWAPRIPVIAVIAAIAVVGTVPTVSQAVTTAELRPVGAAVVPALRARLHLTGPIITAGTYPTEITPLLGGITVLDGEPSDLSGVDMVMVGQPRCRTPIDPTVRALVAANLAGGSLRLVHTDRLVRIYQAIHPLRPPTPAQIHAQPPSNLADLC